MWTRVILSCLSIKVVGLNKFSAISLLNKLYIEWERDRVKTRQTTRRSNESVMITILLNFRTINVPRWMVWETRIHSKTHKMRFYCLNNLQAHTDYASAVKISRKINKSLSITWSADWIAINFRLLSKLLSITWKKRNV